jgi:hypothetical protein
MFTGITAFILAFLFMVAYFVGVGLVGRAARCCPFMPQLHIAPRAATLLCPGWCPVPPCLTIARPLQARGMISLIIDGLWVIFWLVRAAASPTCSRLVFAWLAAPQGPATPLPAPGMNTSLLACLLRRTSQACV